MYNPKTATRRSTGLHVLEGYVTEVYTSDGEVLVDVTGFNPVYRLSQVRVLGGVGLAKSFVVAPPMKETTHVEPTDTHPYPTQNSKVLVLMSAGAPICVLGCVRNEGSIQNKKISMDKTPTPSSGDRSNQVSVFDMSAFHNGCYASISHDGSITFDLKESEQPRVRVQLPKSGHMRISRDGEALERVTLANALQNYINGTGIGSLDISALVGDSESPGFLYHLWERVTRMEILLATAYERHQIMAKVLRTLKNQIDLGTPLVPEMVSAAFNTAIGLAPTFDPFEADLVGIQANNFKDGVPLVDSPPPTAPNNIKSSTLRISNDSGG